MINTLLDILNREASLDEVKQEDKRQLAENIVKALESDFFKKQTAEIHRIELDKWAEGMRSNRDPGSELV